MIKKYVNKEFGCKMECGSDCCSFFIIESIEPKLRIINMKYHDLRGVEVVEKSLDTDYIKDLIKRALEKSKIPSFMARSIDKIIVGIIEAIFTRRFYKIPIACNWKDKNNKCSNYENRPENCKRGGGGNKDNPFRFDGCPY